MQALWVSCENTLQGQAWEQFKSSLHAEVLPCPTWRDAGQFKLWSVIQGWTVWRDAGAGLGHWLPPLIPWRSSFPPWQGKLCSMHPVTTSCMTVLIHDSEGQEDCACLLKARVVFQPLAKCLARNWLENIQFSWTLRSCFSHFQHVL